jgi:hypothetical protein
MDGWYPIQTRRVFQDKMGCNKGNGEEHLIYEWVSVGRIEKVNRPV